MSKLDSNVKKQLHNAKYVTRLAKQRMMNTIIKHGQMAQQMRQPHSIMDRHLIRKDLKTTKFMPSKVKEFKVRSSARMGSMKEIYVEGGGEVPKDLSGLYTDAGAAGRAIDKYLSTRRNRPNRPKAEK